MSKKRNTFSKFLIAILFATCALNSPFARASDVPDNMLSVPFPSDCDLAVAPFIRPLKSFSYRAVLPNGTLYRIHAEIPEFKGIQCQIKELDNGKRRFNVVLPRTAPITLSYENEVTGRIDFVSSTRDLDMEVKPNILEQKFDTSLNFFSSTMIVSGHQVEGITSYWQPQLGFTPSWVGVKINAGAGQTQLYRVEL